MYMQCVWSIRECYDRPINCTWLIQNIVFYFCYNY
jgi:hypothetical protein